jgi:hypothetical protein
MAFPLRLGRYGDGRAVKMRQVALKNVFASVALIAVGCSGITVWMQRDSLPDVALIQMPVGLLAWSPLLWIGAGIGSLFGRWKEGAGCGVLATWLIFYLIALLSSFNINTPFWL